MRSKASDGRPGGLGSFLSDDTIYNQSRDPYCIGENSESTLHRQKKGVHSPVGRVHAFLNVFESLRVSGYEGVNVRSYTSANRI
jgi:hypothetical protein